MPSVAIAARSPVNNRAAISNEPRRFAADTDMRSVEGRRFADIYDGLAAEFGPGADPARLHEIARLKFMLERALSAEACSLEDIVRLTNVIERKERALRAAKRVARGALPSLHDHLVRRSAERALKAGT